MVWYIGAIALCMIGVVLALTDYDSVPQAFNTAFERRCNSLSYGIRARYVDGTCFVSTTERFNETYANWKNLHNRCNHFGMYDGHLAYIKTNGLRDRLVLAKVAEPSTDANKRQYYVSARQTPHSECPHDGDTVCRASSESEMTVHKQNWYWVDKNGEKIQEVDSNLFRLNEPNNGGTEISIPEHVLALEDRSMDGSITAFGLNDVNPERDSYSLLCQYDDFLTCVDGYTLIGDMCYRATPFGETDKWKNFDDAESDCQRAGHKGTLASIHDDDQNYNMAAFAQASSKYTIVNGHSTDDSFMPYIVGLHFTEKEFSWTDGTDVNYFRWWERSGLKNPVDYENGRYHVLLRAATNGMNGVAAYGYWVVGSDNTKHPYICQHVPIKNK